jgi:hypothetical protein
MQGREFLELARGLLPGKNERCPAPQRHFVFAVPDTSSCPFSCPKSRILFYLGTSFPANLTVDGLICAVLQQDLGGSIKEIVTPDLDLELTFAINRNTIPLVERWVQNIDNHLNSLKG